MKTFSACRDEADEARLPRIPRGLEACAIHKGEETVQGGHQHPDEEQLM